MIVHAQRSSSSTGRVVVLAIALLALLVLSCTAASPLPGATPTTAPPPSAALQTAPPDAGIIFFFSSADGRWMRYGDAAKSLDPIAGVWGGVAAETADLIYLVGPQGARNLMRWDGTVEKDYDCGGGGWTTFNAAGACATFGYHEGPGPLPITVLHTPPLYVRRPGEIQPRVVLPADWGLGAAQWSPDSARLAVTRIEPPYPAAENEPWQVSLWIVEADGSARLLYRPARGRSLPLNWSLDGKYLTGWDRSSADSPDRLLLIDVASGRLTDLGNSPQRPEWVQWSRDGRLAFVRGTGDATWRDRQVVVREPDGTQRVVAPPGVGSFVGLAPVWDPSHGRLAWIAGPAGDGTGYLEGTGVGDRRVVVSDLVADATEIRCPGRVVEGVRWSRDGDALLLLCRRPGVTTGVFELWIHRLDVRGAGATRAVVTQLGWDQQLDPRFGLAPSLFGSVAWSGAVR